MSIGRLAFSLVPGGSGPKRMFTMTIDDREYVTGCFLADDLVNLVKRYAEMAEEGRRFDLFFSNAGPFSVSVSRFGPDLYIRLSDSFDGGVLEDRVDFAALISALADLADSLLRDGTLEPAVRDELAKGLLDFRKWRGPVTGT